MASVCWFRMVTVMDALSPRTTPPKSSTLPPSSGTPPGPELPVNTGAATENANCLVVSFPVKSSALTVIFAVPWAPSIGVNSIEYPVAETLCRLIPELGSNEGLSLVMVRFMPAGNGRMVPVTGPSPAAATRTRPS